MENVELNLGPFNDCITGLSDRGVAEYRLLKRTAFTYNAKREPIRIIDSSDDMVTVHLLRLGLAKKNDTPDNRRELIRAV